MLFALLAGQGLRLCLHTADPADAVPAQAATHLESNLLAPGEPDDGADRHVSLGLALLKQVSDGALAILFGLTLIWLLPPVRQLFGISNSSSPPRSRDLRLRPPLRAPPF